jgi:8-oxo-dGTP pyrophosphatase MutT (NUDIX family)
VVALTPEAEVYLFGQYRYPLEEYSWEIVEGGVDEGEEPLAAAKRELQEEAGLVANKWTVLSAGIHLSNCITSERGYLYLAQELSEVGASPESTEVLKVQRVPFAECLRMVEFGEIKDSMTIIAILLAERWLKKILIPAGRP